MHRSHHKSLSKSKRAFSIVLLVNISFLSKLLFGCVRRSDRFRFLPTYFVKMCGGIYEQTRDATNAAQCALPLSYSLILYHSSYPHSLFYKTIYLYIYTWACIVLYKQVMGRTVRRSKEKVSSSMVRRPSSLTKLHYFESWHASCQKLYKLKSTYKVTAWAKGREPKSSCTGEPNPSSPPPKKKK